MSPSFWQLLIVLVVVLILFGNRLPSVMRSLGQGITEFKKGIKDDGTDTKNSIEDQR
jgi:sec-independent protein translocase protein TatA